MHPWARRAALSSICASFQGNEAFWQLAKFLFNNQDAITIDNFDARLDSFARNGSQLDPARLHVCLAQGAAEGILERDEKLAERYHIDAAPTVFIDGVRKVVFSSLEELQRVLHSALAARNAAGGSVPLN